MLRFASADKPVGFANRDGTGNFEKDARWWIKSIGGDDILTADDQLHRRMRRLQSPAFSSKALEAQSPIIEKYTSLLIHQLQTLAATDSSGSAEVDMNLWYCSITDPVNLFAKDQQVQPGNLRSDQ